jgi:hypothetical protein
MNLKKTIIVSKIFIDLDNVLWHKYMKFQISNDQFIINNFHF